MNKPLSGLLVCQLIMSLAETLSSKFHICPQSFASRPNIHFFGQSLSRGHYQPTYQPPEGAYLLNMVSSPRGDNTSTRVVWMFTSYIGG